MCYNSPKVMSATITATSTTPATMLNRNSVKRSLSESSADELYRNSGTVNGDGYCYRKMWRNESIVQQPKERRVSNKSHAISNAVDVVIRIIFVIIFIKLEVMPAFERKIQIEELWLYKNPRTPDYVTPVELILAVILCPFCTTLLSLLMTGDHADFRAANWVWTLVLCFNGFTTSVLKITVGRPRPDFFYRCFPDGIMVLNNDADLNGRMSILNCTGDSHVINEGYKSFPSGHSSFSFAAFSFISFYVGAKLHVFTARGRGETWRMCIALFPLVIAALVAVSRTCDYHHHWQDVMAGSIIGVSVSYFVYRQYYPSIFARNCQRPLLRGAKVNVKYMVCYRRLSDDNDTGDYKGEGSCDHVEPDPCDEELIGHATSNERLPLIVKQRHDNKWI